MRWGGLVALACVGCIDTDAAVFVEAALASPALVMSSSSLAAGVSGEATLSLHLGPRASGPSTAKVLALSLVSADGVTTHAATLGFSSTPTLPLTVGVDDTVAVALALASSDNALPTDKVAAICGGAVRLRVVVDDSLRGGSVSADSDPFQVTGCP
ncbi:MAG: hypothetical protein FJ096_04255 [Deltaproteobacteria bacterium]|nr:hypothetical protein [Deltaproteobacteria bacterium]